MIRLFNKDVNTVLFLIAVVFNVINGTFISGFFPLGNYIIVLSLFLLVLLNVKNARLDFYSLVFIIPISILIVLSVYSAEKLHLGGYNTALFMLLLLSLFFFSEIQFNIRTLNKGVLFFAFIVVFSSYYSWFYSLFSFLDIDKRAGIFLNSNSLGEFVVFLLMYLFLFIKKQKTQMLMSFLAFPLLLISNSRGALLTIFVFLIILGVKKSKTIDGLFVNFISFSVIALLFLIGVYNLFPESIITLLNKMQSSGTTGRIELWRYAIDGILSDELRFLFGTGPSTTVIDGKSLHNAYLNEASNMGVLFVLLYIALIFYKYCYSRSLKKTEFLTIIFPILLLGMFESILFTNSLLWILLVFTLINQSRLGSISR
jgi:hypothetical protein